MRITQPDCAEGMPQRPGVSLGRGHQMGARQGLQQCPDPRPHMRGIVGHFNRVSGEPRHTGCAGGHDRHIASIKRNRAPKVHRAPWWRGGGLAGDPATMPVHEALRLLKPDTARQCHPHLPVAGRYAKGQPPGTGRAHHGNRNPVRAGDEGSIGHCASALFRKPFDTTEPIVAKRSRQA